MPKCEPEDTVRVLKELIDRPIAINLEPAVNPNEENPDSAPWVEGRAATAENARKVVDMGVDLILVTGNPGKHVTNTGIINAIKEIRKEVGDKVIIAARDDIVLIPAPGTVPGITLDWAVSRVNKIHELGKLAMTSIGTSQEGSDVQTIRNIALLCKQARTDIHHIGDTGGTLGVANPDNIMWYSIAIRGKQHTWFRMAQSINR